MSYLPPTCFYISNPNRSIKVYYIWYILKNGRVQSSHSMGMPHIIFIVPLIKRGKQSKSKSGLLCIYSQYLLRTVHRWLCLCSYLLYHAPFVLVVFDIHKLKYDLSRINSTMDSVTSDAAHFPRAVVYSNNIHRCSNYCFDRGLGEKQKSKRDVPISYRTRCFVICYVRRM